MEQTIVKAIARRIEAIGNCVKSGNTEWESNHREAIREIEKNHLPHGNGIDCGCNIDLERSNPNKIVITFSYHRMDDNGMYDGWYDYVLTIRPSLAHDFTMSLVGSNKNDVKEYFYDMFDIVLREIIDCSCFLCAQSFCIDED